MFIRLEPSSGVPITRQIAEQIRTQCASGRLRPGDRLPSVRVLATELAVNQNTILRVYERLTAAGLLERRHGDGTYVADRLPTNQLRQQRELLKGEAQRLAQRGVELGMDVHDLTALMQWAVAQLTPPPGGRLGGGPGGVQPSGMPDRT